MAELAVGAQVLPRVGLAQMVAGRLLGVGGYILPVAFPVGGALPLPGGLVFRLAPHSGMRLAM